jgi:hypothetical protein
VWKIPDRELEELFQLFGPRKGERACVKWYQSETAKSDFPIVEGDLLENRCGCGKFLIGN